MKVLIIHNYYQQPGGEDVVVASEVKLLTMYGHDVSLYTINNNDINGIFNKLITACNVIYSIKTKRTLSDYLKYNKPDIVHVHNFFPLISPSVYDACIENNIPVVQTLHNFRLICPGALLLRNNHTCEECIDQSLIKSVRHSCYRSSFFSTVAVAAMIYVHNKLDTWYSKVDTYIALTEFSRNKYILSGFPSNKITVKPNFIDVKNDFNTLLDRRGALFVGRMSTEKGVHLLLNAWQNFDQTLSLVGSGPLLAEMQKYYFGHNIIFKGQQSSDNVMNIMTSSEFLVMPSIWYEGFPMTILEAFACGLPVIASRLGSMAEIIHDGETGLLFNPNDCDDLRSKIRWAFDHPDKMRKMGENARELCVEKFSSLQNYKQLIRIYESTIFSNNLHNKGLSHEN